MENHLRREDWDFSGITAKELIPALRWEARREYTKMPEHLAFLKDWVDGKLSARKPPAHGDKRKRKRQHYNSNFSEAEIARIRATALFDDFIPHQEFVFLHEWTLNRRRMEFDRWLKGYVRPLMQNHDLPWLCLPWDERRRLLEIWSRSRNANIVQIDSWWDAVGHFKQTKPDGGSPLKFDFSEYTSVFLRINWRFSKKRILAAFAEILATLEPRDMNGIQRWDGRGRKDRDLLVMLERFAVMRLLHHYTLSELQHRLPEAWELYGHRKWYDERRQALKDFRRALHGGVSNAMPKSWLTKAKLSRNKPQVPVK